MSKPKEKRSGYVEPVRHADGSLHFRARVLLADGTRARRPVPPEKCTGRSNDERRAKAETWAEWLQQQEDARGEIFKAEQEKRARAAAARGEPAAGETWNDYVERYAKALTARDVSTAKDIRGRLLNWAGERFGTKPIAAVTRDDLEALVRELDAKIVQRAAWLATPRRDEDSERPGISWKSAGNVWSDTVRMLDEACTSKVPSLRVLTVNPAVGVRGPEGGIERSKPFLRPAEVSALLACAEVPLHRRIVYAVAVYTAMRQGELRALTADDVDLDAMQVRVSKQARKVDEIRHRTKTGRARFVQIEPNLYPLLAWLVEHPMGANGRLLAMHSAQNCADRLRGDLELAGCTREELFADDAQREPISFHKLRHTCGVHMAVRRDAPFDVQWRMGHTNAAMTERYIAEAKQASGSNFGIPLDRLPVELIEALGSMPVGSETAHEEAHDESHQSANVAESLCEGRELNAASEDETADFSGDHEGESDDAPELSAGSVETPTGVDQAVDHGDAMEAALARALEGATAAGRWDVVAQLARELEARRRARAGNVVRLEDAKGGAR